MYVCVQKLSCCRGLQSAVQSPNTKRLHEPSWYQVSKVGLSLYCALDEVVATAAAVAVVVLCRAVGWRSCGGVGVVWGRYIFVRCALVVVGL